MPKSTDFQSIIMTLQEFWTSRGALLWQPYYSQVGAGTMNPATFLRVLGPEPWNVAYVEPSIRPDDGRYGDNPYRFQQHYQFQVIMKPDPGNPQEIYLASLAALGIDPLQHDIRFVEDNWESPALGAWGLGWEVWLDGQEITQFTYFQQAGGINLDPVSVEITYGLERIAMALQGGYHFRKIRWNDQFTWADVNYQGEKEHSTYYFEAADIESVREMYDLYEAEANLALEKGLVLPAHDYILKCSHAFNILDTRGAVGVTERQALFGRMRDLSHRTASAYVAQRKELGFPWTEKDIHLEGAYVPQPDEKQLSLPPAENLPEKADFLLEIGTEELPAADLDAALEQLKKLAPVLFTDLRLDYENISVFGTPRRLTVLVNGLGAAQPDLAQTVKGPPAERAFDKDGKPTRAAEGFANSRDISVKDLKVEKIDGGEYVVASVHEQGRTVFEILPDKLAGLTAALRFPKSMRWNTSGVGFSRPVRWLAALFGEHPVRFEFAGLTSSRVTRGLRFNDPQETLLAFVSDYLPFLEKQGIIIDSKTRKAEIAKQVKKLLASVDAAPEIDDGLLDEVTNLVEAPTALLGNFDPSHLDLPPEVLISVMKKYQRYFPVKDNEGKLMPYFITVRNGGDQHLDMVAKGNEEVVSARFADAAFFIREDSKRTLADFLQRLDTLTFHPKLGSMLDKSKRIQKLVEGIAKQVGLSVGEKTTALAAARLCKADLAAKMVVEMTALQGTMGKYYALKDGVDAAAAEAIETYYQPRSAGDSAPASMPALVVGMADRLDSLVGLFAVGMAPTGTKDPFGLRRAAIGLVQNLIDKNISIDLRESLLIAEGNLPVKMKKEDANACLAFITGRLENVLLDAGFRFDAVQAILAEQGHDPAAAASNVKQLGEWVKRKNWHEILPAFARCVRITRDLKEAYTLQPEALADASEKALYQGFADWKKDLGDSHQVDDFLSGFERVIPQVNAFFDAVLVMDEDKTVRENRLALLQGIASLANGITDFSKLEGF